MASTIKIKNSSTAGAVPSSGDLVQGELAINVTDRRIFTENASGTVVELGTPSIDDNGNATAITIDSSENVGIGTGSPSYKLDVLDTGGNLFRFTRDTTQIGSFVSSGTPFFGALSNHPLALITNSTERARIDTSGNLLVGCTSLPSASVAGWAANVGTAPGYTISSRNTTAAAGQYAFYNPNGLVGAINTSGSSTSFITSSDYRLKENIAPMTGALSVVEQLKPCTYTWKADGSDGQGFIAHELAEVVPDCVSGEKDAVDAEGNPQYQGIDTSFLVATLTAAIQEQQALITTLTERITALENK